MRLLEEVIELAQAEGVQSRRVAALLDHVYNKSPGKPEQEVGGVGVTLLAYCELRGLSADAEERREFDRVRAIDPARFRLRQNVKADAGVGVRSPEDP